MRLVGLYWVSSAVLGMSLFGGCWGFWFLRGALITHFQWHSLFRGQSVSILIRRVSIDERWHFCGNFDRDHHGQRTFHENISTLRYLLTEHRGRKCRGFFPCTNWFLVTIYEELPGSLSGCEGGAVSRCCVPFTSNPSPRGRTTEIDTDSDTDSEVKSPSGGFRTQTVCACVGSLLLNLFAQLLWLMEVVALWPEWNDFWSWGLWVSHREKDQYARAWGGRVDMWL